MASDEIFEFEGRQFKPTKHRKLTPEQQAEADARFHDEPPLPRCMSCWNLEPHCTCKGPELLEFSRQKRPWGLPQEWRDRLDRAAGGNAETMFKMYVEAGINDLDLLANGMHPDQE